jgi:diguanylate cyclase (GGDEF)-like protein
VERSARPIIKMVTLAIRVQLALHNFCGFTATFPIRLGRCGSTDGPSNLSSSQRLYRLYLPEALKLSRRDRARDHCDGQAAKLSGAIERSTRFHLKTVRLRTILGGFAGVLIGAVLIAGFSYSAGFASGRTRRDYRQHNKCRHEVRTPSRCRLEDHSLTDPLTGLPNRRMLMMHLIEAQKRACRSQNFMVLAVLELDGFKTINDRLGHAVGDQKLLSATAAVRTAIRDIDMIARVGGDEFVLILKDLKSLREVKTILYRIVRAVDLDANEGDACYKVTASLGATIYPIDFAEPEILLKHADEAMYQAKRNGGNQFYIKTPKNLDRLVTQTVP